jgi:hypothetical protein
MPSGDRPDPVRATVVAILQQLNRSERLHEGHAHDQALELGDLERLLLRFWAVESDGVKVPLVLGLLVRNGLVEVQTGVNRPPKSRQPARVRYHITADGKRFLVDSLAKTDRIQ